MKKFFLIVSFATLCEAADAQSETRQDKTQYTLFKPVPKDKMREMQTDRPDVTESAYTVDAGHFQLETDLFKNIRNKDQGVLNVQNVYNHANLKLGISNTTDFQVVVENLVQTIISDNVRQSENGFGDITLRIKKNLWGNDGGKTALSAMPYVNLPTSKFSEGGVVEGGIVFPMAVQLKNDWGLGTQAAIDLLKNPSDKNYHTEVLYSITASHPLNERMDFFQESHSTYNFRSAKMQVSLNGGLIYSISENFKLDAGYNVGITKATDKVYFAGLSFRY